MRSALADRRPRRCRRSLQRRDRRPPLMRRLEREAQENDVQPRRALRPIDQSGAFSALMFDDGFLALSTLSLRSAGSRKSTLAGCEAKTFALSRGKLAPALASFAQQYSASNGSGMSQRSLEKALARLHN
jgi:hypothetical protein